MDYGIRELRDAVAGISSRLGKRLQGRHVSAEAPTDNELLGWNATTKKWEPKADAPTARVYNSGNITISDNTATALTFDSERYDTDTIHSTASNTNRLTATTAGKYDIAANVRWAANATGRRTISIREGGDTTIALTQDNAVAGGLVTVQELTTQYDLAADEYVELMVNQNSGGNLNVEAVSNYSPEFMMARLGPRGGASAAVGDDHGTLSGLPDDDHTQYLLATGSRAGSTGAAQDFGSTGLKADVIAESTGAAGVTIDGCPIKDGNVDGKDVSTLGTSAEAVAAVKAEDPLALAGEVTLADGKSLNLQEAITFTGATTENLIEFPDNLADALSFEESTSHTSYMAFITSNGSEAIAFGKQIAVQGNIGVTGTVDGVDIAARDHAQAHGPSDHTSFANWKLIHTDGSGDQQEIAVGADGTVLTGTGAASAPAFEAASGHTHSTPTLIEDADQDTKIQTEEGADEDIIRFDAEGVELMTIEGTPADGKFIEMSTAHGAHGSLYQLAIEPTATTTGAYDLQFGVYIRPGFTSNAANAIFYSMSGGVDVTATNTVFNMEGLLFEARIAGGTSDVSTIYGLDLSIGAAIAYSGAINDARTCRLRTALQGSGAVATIRGLHLTGATSSAVTTFYQMHLEDPPAGTSRYTIFADDITGGTTARLLQLGGAADAGLLELYGSGEWDEAANTTPMYLAEGDGAGGWNVRQVQIDVADGGGHVSAGAKTLVLV